jgi:hypothetical protein
MKMVMQFSLPRLVGFIRQAEGSSKKHYLVIVVEKRILSASYLHGPGDAAFG